MKTPFYKNPYILLAIVIVVAVIIYGYNNWGWFGGNAQSDITSRDVFTRNGSSVNPIKGAKACDPKCLVPYPEGSKYYGYYYCDNACGSAIFVRKQPIYYANQITKINTFSSTPNPDGRPR